MTPQEAKTELERVVKAIKNRNATCLEMYIETAVDLYNLKNSNLYMYIKTADGTFYDSFYTLAEDYFAMSKATVSRYISIYQRFGDMASEHIKPRYKDYSISQLREMLSLTDSQISACTPSMTCEAIHSLKKHDQGKKEEDEFVPDPNNSVLVNFTPELYGKVLARAKKCEKHIKDMIVEIVNLYFQSLKD